MFIRVPLSAEKTETLNSTLQSPMIPVRTLQYAAGVLGWLSSIAPAARPWMAMIWAAFQQALERTPAKSPIRARKGLAFRKQIVHAVRGLQALLDVHLQTQTLKKTYILRSPWKPFVVIETDACPTSMGAVLRIGNSVAYYWYCQIEDTDLELLGGGAERSPSYQSEFELFAIFISVKLFPRRLEYPAQYFFAHRY